ncbi:IclR family transcriptional regulator [Amycolatopsis alkalitolerans]|uniref:IclR family transcriptional regulator n=1 Tax=Amycolatopsis alkalitolerans TaxID=2547244 RepID=A0A5C4LU70_9PSEU|nr:IclR family transcriptional regulator [Amycolatopsis alkalitolerans]TNC22234.1 IclR family transcriptional regulator [Amycolatopsis alkalitolerans]
MGSTQPPDPDGSTPSPRRAQRVKRDYSVRAVERVCLILNRLQENVDGITLNEVISTTGLPKASAFRYLRTLQNNHYIERGEDSVFRLGLGFLGMQSRHLEILRRRALPTLERLRDEFGETANLGLLDQHEVIYIDIAESRRGVRLAALRGDHTHLHASALGKAIASRLPDDRVAEILTATGLPQRTANTITTPKRFAKELDKVRRLGYAIDDQEEQEDGRSVAVPLLGTHLPAAISVSGPAFRFALPDMETVAEKLVAAAADLIAGGP